LLTCQDIFNGYMIQVIDGLTMAETTIERQQPRRFELIAGNLALDFINTLDDRPTDEPKDLLKNYCDLAAFGKQTGIVTSAQFDSLAQKARFTPLEAEDALHRARNLREALHDILWALMKKEAAPQAMDTLNASLYDAALHSRLIQRETDQGEEGCEWRFDDLASSFDAILWPLARTAAHLLASRDVALVRTCSSATCQWFFLDTSKNHRRRWCDMKLCGNRAKVRRFYAKKKQTA
jgi:predicted RNA-binding Zn ribbon-like protein